MLQYKIQAKGEGYVHCDIKMEASLKFIYILALLAIVGIIGIERVDGAGECGKSTPDDDAMKLAPCTAAALDEKAQVSNGCYLPVKKIGQNPSSLCAVILSQTAKYAGIKPEVSLTIPNHCNFANHPVGYKCGREYAIIIFSFMSFLFPFHFPSTFSS